MALYQIIDGATGEKFLLDRVGPRVALHAIIDHRFTVKCISSAVEGAIEALSSVVLDDQSPPKPIGAVSSLFTFVPGAVGCIAATDGLTKRMIYPPSLFTAPKEGEIEPSTEFERVRTSTPACYPAAPVRFDVNTQVVAAGDRLEEQQAVAAAKAEGQEQ